MNAYKTEDAINEIKNSRDTMPKLLVAGSEDDWRVPHDHHQRLVSAAILAEFDVKTYFTKTSEEHSWGPNIFRPQPASRSCTEHVTQIIVDPQGYEQAMVAFFDHVYYPEVAVRTPVPTHNDGGTAQSHDGEEKGWIFNY